VPSDGAPKASSGTLPFSRPRCGRSRLSPKGRSQESDLTFVQVSAASTSGMHDVLLKPQRSGPVHVLYYRVAQKGVIEIVRVLHERMEPSRHLDELPTEGDL
jgi:hypothetical protein